MIAETLISDALCKLLSEAACNVGVAEHSYIVGGAPRDFCLGHSVKDIDVVVETRGHLNAGTLGAEVCRMLGLPKGHADQYGVVHIGPIQRSFVYAGVELQGQKIELVTARKEKYDKSRVKESHKPTSVEPGTILEDLERRDFTINTLVWRLDELRGGIEGAPVRDLLGQGRKDLDQGILCTPLDPSLTFEEDPSRMLRGLRFSRKYGFTFEEATQAAILRMASELRRLPYEIVDMIFFEKMLTLPVETALGLISDLERFALLPIIREMIPSNRLRRAIDPLDVRLQIELCFHGFSCGLAHKISDAHRSYLYGIRGKEPPERLELIVDRFLKPPIDTKVLMQQLGISGPAVGRAITRAQELLLEDPLVAPEKLQERLTAILTP